MRPDRPPLLWSSADGPEVRRAQEGRAPEHRQPGDVSPRGGAAKQPSRLDGQQTAAVFDGMDWLGEGWRARAEASPPPSLRQSATRYFADFPWGD